MTQQPRKSDKPIDPPYSGGEGGLSEVELGQLAERKPVSVDVKEFAALMVKDHSAANEKLKALACTKAIILPGTPGVMRTSNRTKLKLLSGNKFDKSYIKGMIVDHKDDIKEFQKEADHGRDPQAKAFAAEMLSTLRLHLQKIREIEARSGIKTS